MPRYFTARKPKALWTGDDTWVEPMIPALTVCDHEATDTGILDADGEPIMRAPRPIGFGRDDQW